MANIAVRKEAGKPSGGITRRWQSPFEMARDLFRWDPFEEMAPAWMEERAFFAPDFDVKETKEAFIFKADIPGVKSEDLDVKITQNRLTVSGKKEEEREEKTDTVYRRERSFGSFSRSFTIPEGTDGDRVNAELKNGVLTLTLPKKPEAKAKHVNIKSS